jgi:hypothetical protein
MLNLETSDRDEFVLLAATLAQTVYFRTSCTCLGKGDCRRCKSLRDYRAQLISSGIDLPNWILDL